MPAAGLGGVRETPQRLAVLRVLRRAHDHPTAAEVLERVQRVHPGIGAATVYRTLNLLVANGTIQALALEGAEAARYDATAHGHDHLVCQRCGKVDDLPAQLSAGTLAAVARRTGFAIDGYELRFRGHCAQCAADTTEGSPDA